MPWGLTRQPPGYNSQKSRTATVSGDSVPARNHPLSRPVARRQERPSEWLEAMA